MIIRLTHNLVEPTHRLIKQIILSTESYSDVAKEEQTKIHSVENLHRCVNDKNRHDLVFLDADRVVAFTLSSIENYGEYKMLNWEWLGLIPRYRSTGIANDMWYTLELWAKEQNVDGVVGYSLTHNIPMFKYMSKLKFNVWKTLNNHWYGQDYFLWGKFYGNPIN